MSGKMFYKERLQSIGSKRKDDPKAGLFSFNFLDNTKMSSASARSEGPEPETRSRKPEKSRSPQSTPGDRVGRIRSRTSSFLEIDGPIGSKRRKDVKSELFSFGFLNQKSSSTQASKSGGGTVLSPTNEDSGYYFGKKRRSSRVKSLSIFNSSDESAEEENEEAIENRDDVSPGPAKSRKLSNGKNTKIVKELNPINNSSAQVRESKHRAKSNKRDGSKKSSTTSNDCQHDDDMDNSNHDLSPNLLKKRGRPKKPSTTTDDHKHNDSLDNSNHDLTPNLRKKRGRPKKPSTTTHDQKHDENVDDSTQEDSQSLRETRGRLRKLNMNTSYNLHDESMDDNNHEESSPTQLERTHEVVENGSNGNKSDSEDDSVEVLSFVIEQAQSDYMKLKNSDITNNVLVVPEDCTKTVAGFMAPDFASAQCMEYPGVTGIQNSLSDSLGVGYMKIEGNTIRPPEMSTSGQMIYWILEGSIKVKSAGGHYPRRDSSGEVTNYLYGKKLDRGTCIVLPKMTPYTFENWDSADAVLGFCILKDE